jgi:hypothetical protein
MSDDTNVVPFQGADPKNIPGNDLYPMPWTADEVGRIHDAKGRQVGALVRADLAQLAVRVLNAAVALSYAKTDQST